MFRSVTVALVLGCTGIGGLMGAAVAQQNVTAIICTNPANGVSWRVRIDYANDRVDTYQARITAGTISWFDPTDGGNYTLDRRTGALTGTVASSTGGYFRRGRCEPTPPK